MKLYRRHPKAFTFVEAMISTAIFSMLGLVTYGLASEGLYAFSRNISINRSALDARRALDRIGNMVQSAGYTPLLTDATGASTNVTPAAGIRVWRYGTTPCYDITTPSLTSSTINISLYDPTTVATPTPTPILLPILGGPLLNPTPAPASTPVSIPPPAVGDLITISAIGFQAKTTAVTVNGNSAVLTFASTVAANCTVSSIPTKDSNGNNIQYSCLDYTPSAIIAVGTQLRYYPTFIYGTTAINTTTNYKVLANLVTTVGVSTAPLPFTLGTSPTINVDLYAEAPDYNNRGIGTAYTYIYLQTSFAARNPTLLTSPY